MGILTDLLNIGLADALFSQVQQRVLGLLFGQPERRFQGAELIRLAQGGTGAVHRQLTRLERVGLVTVTRIGNQKYYQANPDSAVYQELHGLIVKTVGMVGPLRAALEPLAASITAAFVFGSVAKGTDRALSDIDVMILAQDLSYPELYTALKAAEHVLGRQVNPTVMTPVEWQTKQQAADSFATRVAGGPKLFVLGDEDAIAGPPARS